MERQFLVAQLTMLLEQGAAQNRFRRQPLASSRLDAVATEVSADPAQHLAMLVKTSGHRLQFTAKLVGEQSLPIIMIEKPLYI